MSDFLNKAKDLVDQVDDKIPDSAKDKIADVIEQVEEKLPDSVEQKVAPVTDKIKDVLRGDDDAPAKG